ncbi:E3 ubiquitin-protein ligase TRIM33-like [Mercenaria mercenaria]|uniref:E3 ubiquitin-protein ligase TRIM33-like n=1 Tax=Mercenaria mercenaria TaxID=6596 RepID=UPI00234F6FEA|nr:E3 ubiquitin-protein ligase TRIM33-like [Mercenaria mercenaria]
MGASNGKEENSDNSGPSNCEPCRVGEVKREAEAFCVPCAEFLCVECARDHRKNKLTRNHVVLNGKDMPDDSSVFKTMKSMVSCQDHPGEEVSYKCKTHSIFVCHKCFAVNHRNCDEITELNSAANVHENEYTRTVLLDKLKTVHDMTISTKLSKEENLMLLLEKQRLLKQKRDRFIKHLNEISEQLEKETENLVLKETEVLEKDIDACKDIEKEETLNQELVDNVVRSESSVWLKVVCDLVDKEVDLLKDKTNELRKKETVSLQFKPNPYFQTLKKIPSIGDVQMIQGEAQLESENKFNLEVSSDAVEM